ncbi:MAG: hypothetical protein RQ751_06135, partial [Longimicrobiales bacterium]|nr:hypothetical protein [Longimicrobiales bacterium]
LLLYGGVAAPPFLRFERAGDDGPTELQGLELLNLVSEDEDAPDRPQDPPREVVERQPVPVETRADAPPAAAEEPEPGRPVQPEDAAPAGVAAAERLRVRIGDERLWAPLTSEELAEVTIRQFLESDLAWRLGLWQDSMALAGEREARATDWTYTDEDGNRWGVSPGKLHLGSITLPLPFNFGINPGRYEDAQERAYLDAEIRRGTVGAEVRATWKERAEAIRKRRNAEREEAAREAARAGPRRSRPDTTRAPGQSR